MKEGKEEHKFLLRIPSDLFEKIGKEAGKQRRSINSTIEVVLMKAFKNK